MKHHIDLVGHDKDLRICCELIDLIYRNQSKLFFNVWSMNCEGDSGGGGLGAWTRTAGVKVVRCGWILGLLIFRK